MLINFACRGIWKKDEKSGKTIKFYVILGDTGAENVVARYVTMDKS